MPDFPDTDATEFPDADATESVVPDTDATVPVEGTRRGHSHGSKTDERLPWSTFVALLIALAALAVGVVGWFRPPSPDSRKFSGQQTTEAKASMCEAATKVSGEVTANTHMSAPPGDQTGAFVVAVNARLALYAGGGYLRDRLAAQPATPRDLAKTITEAADTLDRLAIGYLANDPNEVQKPLRDEFASRLDEINKLCQ